LSGDQQAHRDEALDRLASHAWEQVATLQRAVERVSELTVSARSADGLVHVEVGAQGQLLTVRLDDGVYHQMPPAELAGVITALVRDAGAEAAQQARQIMGPLLPGGLPAGQDWWQWLPPDGTGSTRGAGGPAW
jgi:DNA-binding protein YbaB